VTIDVHYNMGRKRKAELYDLCCSVIKRDDMASWNTVRRWFSASFSFREAARYQGSQDRTPLHVILEKNPPHDVIKIIVSAVPEILQIKDRFGRLPIHVAIFDEATLAVVQELIQRYPGCLSVGDKAGQLPVHVACRVEDIALNVIQLLIQQTPRSLTIQDINGRLPIHLLCRHDPSLEVLSLVIDSYPDGVKVKDRYGRLPIQYTCSTRTISETEVKSSIRNYITADDENDIKITATLAGYYNSSFKVIKKLVDSYPESKHVEDLNGIPISLAFKVNRRVTEADKNGMIALHHAYAQNLQKDMIRRLAEAYPEGENVFDKCGKRPYDYAQRDASTAKKACKSLMQSVDSHTAVKIEATSEACQITYENELLVDPDAEINTATEVCKIPDKNELPVDPDVEIETMPVACQILDKNELPVDPDVEIETMPVACQFLDKNELPVDPDVEIKTASKAYEIPEKNELPVDPDVEVETISEGSRIPDETELLLDITQTELWQKVESEMEAKVMDVSEMKNDVKDTKSELTQLKSEVSVMKSDIAQLTSFAIQIKAEMNAHFSDVKHILGSLRSN
jgi:hypothetical protein